MFGRIGMQELILILALALIIFGPRKLPEIGRSIGQGLREFKKATNEIQKSVSLDEAEKENENIKSSAENNPVVEKAEGNIEQV